MATKDERLKTTHMARLPGAPRWVCGSRAPPGPPVVPHLSVQEWVWTQGSDAAQEAQNSKHRESSGIQESFPF